MICNVSWCFESRCYCLSTREDSGTQTEQKLHIRREGYEDKFVGVV